MIAVALAAGVAFTAEGAVVRAFGLRTIETLPSIVAQALTSDGVAITPSRTIVRTTDVGARKTVMLSAASTATGSGVADTLTDSTAHFAIGPDGAGTELTR